jgi:O-antigen/teichoic acid export membrane protein
MGKKELTKNSAIVFAATFISSASTFIFQVMMGRSMDMNSFGAFNALISIQLIFSVFTGALILLYTRYSASFWTLGEKGKLHGLYSHAWRSMSAIAVIAFLAVTATSFLWGERLNIGSKLPIILASFLIASYFIQSVPLAFVRGMQRFTFFFYGLGTSGLLKLVLGALFIYLGITVEKALLALLLSVLVSIVIIHKLITPLLGERTDGGAGIGSGEMLSYGARAVAATFFPMFFINVDMILIRSIFAPEVSGHYAAFGVVGKIIFLGGQIVAVALFPATVSGEASKVNYGNDLVSRAILLVFLGGGAVTLLASAFPLKIMSILFRIDDPYIASMLPWYCGVIMAVSLLLIEANHRLARGEYGFLWVAGAAAVLQLVGIFHFAGSLDSIIRFQLVLFWTAAVIRMASLLLFSRAPEKVAAGSAADKR